MDIPIIFSIAILVMSVVIHEVAHGYAALSQGDVTAKYAGRLTMNPIKHIDPFGSIILPIIFALLPGGIILGWAKPVPYNPYNLRNRKWGELIVAIAGPLSNIAIAILFGLLIRFSDLLNLPISVIQISYAIVFMNVILAVFNMIPVPPLDGSKVLFSILPTQYSLKFRANLERYGFFLVLAIVFLAWQFIMPIVRILMKLFTGI
ncbi:MAG TPA: site-2 protease family protein [Candidatus Paceibacterota bacterium]|nr:site-2 protease family protein [Candidatus Paceibacterota bacterium]HMP19025.1 site-2 protease family protein [Candidatus Paceibacterota bacterium]HMP85467.1 site-2 protease family protein [Candidatus Paceibacterota bacterium]